ncbi:MAG: U32 family peptidase, partial [Methanothrix sp.]|nr:U32 family peptidase [Methanothrix sp.]
MKRLPELLAPAGSPEALRAAVAAGADAVYIGGRLFGARMLARNFNDRELEEAIDYAHLHGVKAYVTVNTLVRDEELERVGEYLIRLYGMGADAILVQDLGVAALARRVVPELGLHASTQMTIHSREGAAFAARMGFGRVVLARELSLGEIEGMADVGIGLEAFVHGALCYSYSGQCLLSSAIGGRSGNRGMCAQPCRKPYLLMRGGKDEFGRPKNLQAVHLRDRFLLSTRDLSVYRSLDRIVGCPLASIKIEGRMKSAEYVAIVTSIYRRALDAIAKGAWRPSPEDERDLALAFNRGFTEGYILGARDVMGREMPDNRGLLIGSVISYDSKRREASVRLAGSLVPEEGDGLVIRGPGQEMGLVVSGARLKGGIFRLRTDGGVRPGARVYLTGSRALARRAQEIVSSQPRRIPIDILLRWDDRTPIAEARLEGGICVQVRGMRMEEATSQPLSSDQIEAQIKRTGGTPFVVRGIKIDYPGGLFSPLSALNMLRRDLLAAAREAILAASRPSSEGVASARERLKEADLQPSATSSQRAPALSAYVDSLEQAHEAVEGGCSRIYMEVPIGECALDLLQEARGICHGAEIVWKWPRITRNSYIDQAGQMLHRADVDGVMVEGVDGLQAVRERMPRMRVYG